MKVSGKLIRAIGAASWLDQAVDVSPVPMFVIDRQHRITHWNRACAALTGACSADMIGRGSPWRIFYPNERPLLADLVVDGVTDTLLKRYYHYPVQRSELIEGAYEAEDYFPQLKGGGRWLFFTAAPLRDDKGNVVGAIETIQDFTARRNAEAALRDSEERYRELSITDALTGLYNSRHFWEQLNLEMERAQRYGTPLSLILLDVDHFKQLNDTYGHLVGDHVLGTLGSVIRRNLRSPDSAYRYGGEEFALILPETSLEGALATAERLRTEFALSPLSGDLGCKGLTSTVSIGVTNHGANDTPHSFVKRADQAVYDAKHRGRDTVVGMDVTVTARQA
ncbi:MAG: diguanylate cyclase [Burkholderiaceae bacterium]|nr:MAG: diguanylate cyclase [Burkholderiaceae bacterium]